ncbi:Hsp20/alpha crystallin family protein [Portibacter marinus]|uniref:Hsp20/alpha crystallin family protein n=1 Tax=Portibacter marinus TaxID=2898660 RepID=UPI001F26E18E|nr:Hsp20/alpha crystallin family protein [Portibacter marinus]
MYTTKNNNGHMEIFPQIDNLLKDIFNGFEKNMKGDGLEKHTKPAANIKEFKDRFEIDLSVPGFDKADISLQVEKQTLSVSADKKMETEQKFQRREFNYGQFERKFKLPNTIDISTVQASLVNGVLKITIDKRKEDIDQGPKTITVQ